ncbi:head GIN domain-containing protein [Marinilabilia salmonicolor]|uniref:head GIN domain-containing protein n=1 Tax=Marinilabilia salmonicolor TaxID=989 RepID=UPI00029AE4C9|nr:head GIN domain-containing protein [Marinilabilia salmonicolor]
MEGKTMTRYLIMIAAFLIPAGMTGCLYDYSDSDNHSENQLNIKHETGDFSSVKLSGNYFVRLENAEVPSVEIITDEETRKNIFLDIHEGVLTVSNVEKRRFNNRKEVELIIKAPRIISIEVKEAATITSELPFRFDSLNIESAGALKMDMELLGDRLTGTFAGATNLNLRGSVVEVKLNMPGAGKVNAFDLKTEELDLSMSGAAKAEVFASKRIHVDASGACSIVYKGNPEQVYTNVTGIGRVHEAR